MLSIWVNICSRYTKGRVYFWHTRICMYRILKFVTRYEAVEEKGRCFVKTVLYPLGVRNVVTTIVKRLTLAI